MRNGPRSRAVEQGAEQRTGIVFLALYACMNTRVPLLLPGDQAANALVLVSRFGWLRAPELGRLLAPNLVTNRKSAERALRKLAELRYVTSRRLPGVNSGSAFVVSKRGMAWLRSYAADEETAKAYSDGLSWGRVDRGMWAPPASWLHDLHAAGMLGVLAMQGHQVVSDLELRRLVGDTENTKKHPDGLAIQQGSNGPESIWIEVEQARKTGANLEAMLRAVAAAARGNPVTTYPGLPPVKKALIAIPADGRDERGFVLDHRGRLIRRINKMGVSSEIVVGVATMTMKGVGVESATIEWMRFQPKAAQL